MTNPCNAIYDRDAKATERERQILDSLPGLDRSPIRCFRNAGHIGSHVARREAHVSIWDDEMFHDFYAADGFAAECHEPIAAATSSP
jgi:hypothetical protein